MSDDEPTRVGFWEGLAMLGEGDESNQMALSSGTAAASFAGDETGEVDYSLSEENQELWDDLGDDFDQVREDTSPEAIQEAATEAATGVDWWKLKGAAGLIVAGVGLYLLRPILSIIAGVAN